MSQVLDDGVETIVFVGRVFDQTGCAISFQEGVGSLDLVTITVFPGGLVVTSVGVGYGVVEVVFGVSLEEEKIRVKHLFLRSKEYRVK